MTARRDVAAAGAFDGFPARGFTFLRGLARHNEREWFEAHRDDYERFVRAPMAALVEECDVRLATVAPEMVGDPKRALFRIHRDVRFSNDKSPYKTFLAAWLHHRDEGRTAEMRAHGASAGFYLHFEPRASFIAGGTWLPPAVSLRKIREALDDDPRAVERIVRAPAFVERFGALEAEDSLTRVPRGYDADHPAAPWLQLRSFMARRRVPDAAMRRADLPVVLMRDVEALVPLVRWLNGVFGYRPSTRR